MDLKRQVDLANKFQQLHLSNKMFIIPNAWDIGSGLLAEKDTNLCVICY